MRTIYFISTIIGPAILLRVFFPDTEYALIGAMVALGAIFAFNMPFPVDDLKKPTAEQKTAKQKEEYLRFCQSCRENPGTHMDPDGGSGTVCEDCAKD